MGDRMSEGELKRFFDCIGFTDPGEGTFAHSELFDAMKKQLASAV